MDEPVRFCLLKQWMCVDICICADSKNGEKIHFATCLQIRGMSIDEAIAQLEFNDKKGAKIMKEV